MIYSSTCYNTYHCKKSCIVFLSFFFIALFFSLRFTFRFHKTTTEDSTSVLVWDKSHHLQDYRYAFVATTNITYDLQKRKETGAMVNLVLWIETFYSALFFTTDVVDILLVWVLYRYYNLEPVFRSFISFMLCLLFVQEVPDRSASALVVLVVSPV